MLTPSAPIALFFMILVPPYAKEQKFEPVIFGTYQGNVGCVILKQQYGVRKKWLATGTILAVGEYEVVQTFNYDVSQTKFKGQEGANELNRIAQKERIKFVVIPRRYTDSQLTVARDECKKNLPEPRAEKPSAQPIPSGAGINPPDSPLAEIPAYEASTDKDVVPPKPIYKPEPPYTKKAREEKWEGMIKTQVVVDASGTVIDARIVTPGPYGLDESVLETVRKWRFEPATKQGKPIPVRVFVEVSFKLFR